MRAVWSITVQRDEENNLSKQWNIRGLVSVCAMSKMLCTSRHILATIYVFLSQQGSAQMGYVIGLKTSHRNTRESHYTYKHIL